MCESDTVMVRHESCLYNIYIYIYIYIKILLISLLAKSSLKCHLFNIEMRELDFCDIINIRKKLLAQF